MDQTKILGLLNDIDSHLLDNACVTLRNKGLIERLKTFKDATWKRKPMEVSPLVCASYGWINDREDNLKCSSCGASLNCRLHYLESTSNEILECSNRLKYAHEDRCHWRTHQLPQEEYTFPVFTRKQAIYAFNERKESLASHVDRIDIAFQNNDLNGEDIVLKLLDDIKTEGILALFGWSKGYVENTIQCRLCLRQCGLWVFQSENGPIKPFNPLREHRYH